MRPRISLRGLVRPSVGPSVGPSVRQHESKSGKARISAPAHPSATGGHVSGLVQIMFYGKQGVARILTNQWGFARPSSIYFSLGRGILFHFSFSVFTTFFLRRLAAFIGITPMAELTDWQGSMRLKLSMRNYNCSTSNYASLGKKWLLQLYADPSKAVPVTLPPGSLLFELSF